MIKGLSGDVTINVIASIIASLVLLAAGFLWGKYKERRKYGRNLEDYDFYPFTINRENFPEFHLKDFRLGIHYFLKNNDYTAARQLIFIGEKTTFAPSSKLRSKRSMPGFSRNTMARKLPTTPPSIWKIISGLFA